MLYSLIITDSKKNGLKHDTDILLWSGHLSSKSRNVFSLNEIVEENAQYCKKEYSSLILKLGELIVENKNVINHLKIENDFSFWWTTLIIEKSNIIKSPEINNAIKIIAFKKWLKKRKYKKIILYSHNLKLIKALSKLCFDINIEFEINQKENEKTKVLSNIKFYKKFPNLIQSIAWLFWEIFSIWPLKGVGIKKWKKSKSKITFFSYLTNLDSQSLKFGEFKSNHWPTIPEYLKKKKLKSNWLHMYNNSGNLNNVFKFKKLINKFNKSKGGIETHATIYSFINFFVVCKVLFNLIKLSFLKNKLSENVSSQCGIIWPFIESDFNESLTGITASRNLLLFYLFRNAFINLSNQKKGFYLQENQGWENSLIYSWKKSKHKNHLIAIPHTPPKFWDLRGIYNKRTYLHADYFLLPLPDFIGFNSNYSKKLFLKRGVPVKKLTSVEALRYLYLKNDDKSCGFKNSNSSKLRILVLGDVLKKSTLNQLRFLKKSSINIKNPPKIFFKPHPASLLTLKEYNFKNLNFTYKPINEIINCFNLVITSSTTSSSFDAYFLGAKVVIIPDEHGINLSPLRDYNDVVFLRSPLQLANIINGLNNKNSTNKKRKNILNIDLNTPKWKKILDIK